MKDYCETVYIRIPHDTLRNILIAAAEEGLLEDFYAAIFNNEMLSERVEIEIIKEPKK
jgi:hypothetical protein